MSRAQPLGLHHITAIATDPQRNVDFYASALGLRLIKQTVNFDAPDTYHLYYGDEAGTPGTVMTFFPWPHAPAGQRGTGQATTVAFSIPEGSAGWWADRLRDAGVEIMERAERADADVVAFADPDGLRLELLAHEGADARGGWPDGPVPTEKAVRGFHSTTFTEADPEPTAQMLTERLGFQLLAEDGNRLRFGVDDVPGKTFEIVATPHGDKGLVAAGTVHHVAWRTPDVDTQRAWRDELVDAGVSVTPIIDRQYFQSIYFREPGGVLLEIATDPPGFTTDEPLLELGQRLRLPPWLEPRREQIEALLPPLKIDHLPGGSSEPQEGSA